MSSSVDRSEVRGGLGRLCRNSTFLVDAAQRVQHALEDGDKAEAAGVNHACLFKHRILVNGLLECGAGHARGSLPEPALR